MTVYGVMTQRWGWQPTARMLDGLPSWAWRCAPPGLLTRRQMRVANLAPGGAEPVAQVICRRGRRRAYLYDPAELVPKRVASPAQLHAVAKAVQARRWCPTGGHYADYCIPTSLGECIECHYTPTPTHTGGNADTTGSGRRAERLSECRDALGRAREAVDQLAQQPRQRAAEPATHAVPDRWAEQSVAAAVGLEVSA